jgi:hypothetical protein
VSLMLVKAPPQHTEGSDGHATTPRT